MSRPPMTDEDAAACVRGHSIAIEVLVFDVPDSPKKRAAVEEIDRLREYVRRCLRGKEPTP